MSKTHKAQALLLLLMLSAIFMPIVARGLLSIIVRAMPLLKQWNDEQLNGTVVPAPRPHLTLPSWLSGDFQPQFEHWFNQNFAGRAFFVHLNNQIGYSLFNRSYTRNPPIVIGKDGQLFEAAYLYETTGVTPPVQQSELEDTARQIAQVQERLKRRGIGFVLMLTPTKSTVYPEYMPYGFRALPTPLVRSNDLLLPLLQRYRVNYIDGPQLLLTAKATSPYPLFCRGGTHYNYLGAFYEARALAAKIAEVTGRQVPDLVCESVTVDKHPIPPDDDLAQLLNLFAPPLGYPVPHPKLRRGPGPNDLSGTKISVVGGSFDWTPLDELYDSGIFHRIDFYFYYRQFVCVWPGRNSSKVDVTNLDWNKTFLDSSVIVLELNPCAITPGTESHYRTFLADALKHLPE